MSKPTLPHEDRASQPDDDDHISLAESVRRLETALEVAEASALTLRAVACFRGANIPERYEAALADLLSLAGIFERVTYRFHGRLIDEWAHHVASTNGGIDVNFSEFADHIPVGVAVELFRNEILKRIDSTARRTLQGFSVMHDPLSPRSRAEVGWRGSASTESVHPGSPKEREGDEGAPPSISDDD